MLAASTIGPGSVVILSKSGAQFDLKLAWTVLVGAAAAFVMSEGAGRLYLISGHDLGGAMRVHFGVEGRTPLISHLMAWCLVFCGVVISCGQAVGAMAGKQSSLGADSSADREGARKAQERGAIAGSSVSTVEASAVVTQHVVHAAEKGDVRTVSGYLEYHNDFDRCL